MFLLFVEVLTVLIIILLISMNHDIIHWIIFVGIRVSVYKPDIDDHQNIQMTRPDQDVS